MRCPECHELNPDEVNLCPCGYRLKSLPRAFRSLLGGVLRQTTSVALVALCLCVFMGIYGALAVISLAALRDILAQPSLGLLSPLACVACVLLALWTVARLHRKVPESWQILPK